MTISSSIHSHHRTGKNRILVCFASVALAISSTLQAADNLSPAFSFQGQLEQGGQAANGFYDLAISLYDASTNGNQLGVTQVHTAVPITRGGFNLMLNGNSEFGPDAFGNKALWLEISVRTNANILGNNYTLLTPRQPLNAVPQAQFAATADRAMLADDAAKAMSAEFAKATDWAASADFATQAKNATTAASAQSVGWMGITGILTGPGISVGPNKELRANFGGDGVAETSSRSDHRHFDQDWVGNTAETGLSIQNQNPSGIAIRGKLDQYGSGFEPASAGVFGDASTGPGVAGFSNIGPGLYGWNSAVMLDAPAILGESSSTTGSVLRAHAKATSGNAAGVFGKSDAQFGIGVKGVALATINANNYGGWFEAGSGAGVFGRSMHGSSGYFSTTNVNNTQPALKVESFGRGSAGIFEVHNNLNTDEILSVWGNGSGYTLKASAAGNGVSGKFISIGTGKGVEVSSSSGVGIDVTSTGNSAIKASASAQDTVSSYNTGVNAALSGNAPNGRGVEGYSSTGSALYGRAPNGTALEVDGGSIKVKGAGINTSTAVFVHKCTAGNLPATGPYGNFSTVIDNPICNNRPDAMLFVTARTVVIQGVIHPYDSLSVSYSSTLGKWKIDNGSLDEVGDFDVGDEFNVMVIVP